MEHRIYCYGDSDTYGYDPRSFLGGRYPKTVRWTALLQQAGWSVQNDGENGRCIPCTDWETQRLQRELRRQQAEALVIMLGCNDLLRQPRRTAEACGERMERFLSGLLAWDLEAPPQILLVAPPPMTLGTWVEDAALPKQTLRLAVCYQSLAQRLGIGFADGGAWGVEMTFDGVHFSEAGHRAFFQGIQPALCALFQAAT